MDPRSSYSTSKTFARKRDKRKRKRVQRSPVSCSRDSRDDSKIGTLAHSGTQEHKIRMRSDERN